MQLFYTPGVSGDEYIFEPEEARHLLWVLRKKIGDQVHHTDGFGNLFHSVIIDDRDKNCMVRINKVEREYGKRNFHLCIAIAPTKNTARLEWFVEKATEIGIDRIIPFFGEHSERRNLNNDRLEKVIISAMKQSVKAYKPILEKAVDFENLVKQGYSGQKFFGWMGDGNSMSLGKGYKPGSDVCILIGPEGDFSHNEVQIAQEHGFVPINLGNSRLRTETAAIVACSWINLLNQTE
ncbi:MAG: 16S rRNA (uracil(1498)-N(3))-methyltransferase [Bacteroidetes bacterium]|nr:16S rRNA (uracil(1498)-N(3))-methyltransferase [Bacteroidota bacterium]